ncbi:MAG: hypothetical protein R2991_03705 [Thermoanaerobaculia bacterium]
MRQLGLFRTPPPQPAVRLRSRRTHRKTAGRGWQGPTLSEFVARAEGEFASARRTGRAFRLASDCLGLAASDRLDAESVRTLCDQWGLPAEDFGLDG